MYSFFTFELVFSIVLAMIVYFQLVKPIQNTDYLYSAVSKWERYPIIHIKLIDKWSKCNNSTMIPLIREDLNLTGSNKTLDLKGEYNNLANAYFWNLKTGCLCPSKLGTVVGEECTDAKLARGCLNVPDYESSYEEMNIINGKQFCALTDTSYRMIDIKRPEANGKCNASTSLSKLCGTSENGYCISANSECPITKITIEDGKIIAHRDPSLGSPIIDLIYSEGGAPCINPNKRNAMPAKQSHKMLTADYFEGCDEILIG